MKFARSSTEPRTVALLKSAGGPWRPYTEHYRRGYLNRFDGTALGPDEAGTECAVDIHRVPRL